MNLRQAAQRALKAMEDGEDRADMIEFSDALVALRAALAEPEQPVALSDEEIVQVLGNVRESITGNVFLAFARAIERAHGIGDSNE